MVDKQPERIQEMFARIAPRYDRANHVLSMRLDVAWRRRVARRLLPAPGRVLDLAAGTGDLTVDLARHGSHSVVAADFTIAMLAHGKAKLHRAAPRARQVGADALRLPFADGAFDGVTVAFGVRNFSDALAGLCEIFRVTRRGGAIGILEFSTPTAPFRIAYGWYIRRLLPAIGGLITGHRDPYEYLPRSVGDFPQGAAFVRLLEKAGYERVTESRMSGGIVTFYRGEKP